MGSSASISGNPTDFPPAGGATTLSNYLRLVAGKKEGKGSARVQRGALTRMFIVRFSAESFELFTRWDWPRLLELAELGGWQPECPAARMLRIKAIHARWEDGARFEVSHGDALLLADALERTLLDLPNHDCAQDKAPAIRHASGAVAQRVVMPGETLSVLEDFSGERKELVRSWVQIFRDGGSFSVKTIGPNRGLRGWWESD